MKLSKRELLEDYLNEIINHQIILRGEGPKKRTLEDLRNICLRNLHDRLSGEETTKHDYEREMLPRKVHHYISMLVQRYHRKLEEGIEDLSVYEDILRKMRRRIRVTASSF